MPLIDCGACGRQISTEAIACPQCGHPNRPPPRTPGYKLSWQQLRHAADAAETDVERTFALELNVGDWLSLEAPDGIGLLATVEVGGLYSLVQTDVRTKESLWAQAKLTKAEAREAFLQFVRGDPQWRTSREWAKTPKLPV